MVTLNGAKTTTANRFLKLQIESSGDFKGRANKVTHNFLSRALALAYEYDVTNGKRIVILTLQLDVISPVWHKVWVRILLSA